MRRRAAFLTACAVPLLGFTATTFNRAPVALDSIATVGLFVTPSTQDEAATEAHGPWAGDVMDPVILQESLATIARLAGTLDGVRDQMIIAKNETLFLYTFQDGPCDVDADAARRERLKALAKLEGLELSVFPRDCFRIAVRPNAHRGM